MRSGNYEVAMPLLMTYEPSGKIHPAGLFGLPLLAAISSSVLACFYIWAAWHCPVVILRAFLPAVWGLLTGIFAGLGVYWFNIRSPKLAVVLSLAGALAGYALSWALWTDLALSRPDLAFFVKKTAAGYRGDLAGNILDRSVALILNPDRIINAAKFAYDHGLWEVFRSGRNFTGPALIVIWLAEAALYFTPVAYKSLVAAGRPFSESANSWLMKQPLPGIADLPEGSELAIGRIKNGDVSYLNIAPREKKGLKSSHLVLTLFTPEEPDDWSFVSVTHMRVSKRGRLEPEELVRNLAINPQMARSLKSRFGPERNTSNHTKK